MELNMDKHRYSLDHIAINGVIIGYRFENDFPIEFIFRNVRIRYDHVMFMYNDDHYNKYDLFDLDNDHELRLLVEVIDRAIGKIARGEQIVLFVVGKSGLFAKDHFYYQLSLISEIELYVSANWMPVAIISRVYQCE